MNQINSTSRFSLGQLVATPGALEALKEAGQRPQEFLLRHMACDWGDLCDDDKAANNEALESGARLLSAYKLSTDKLWIITEADRSSTCILLPSEY
jgi:hypothetical protein